jgi:negative regulator of flagellin synthesis FlgM
MRINGFGTGSVEDRERPKADPATTAAPAKGGESSVIVSPGAQVLSAAVSRGDAARSERVAAVREQVQSGTYQVDRQKLAERIADDELVRAGKA